MGLTAIATTSPASAGTPAAGGHHYGRSLFGTDGVAAGDVWAVGLTPGDRAAIRHWDGKTWTVSPHPVSDFSSVLVGVDARTTGDVWTVGAEDPDGQGIRVAYAQHWDGSRWRVVDVDPGLFTSEADAVSARTARDVWIVGEALKSPAGFLLPFAEHWDGTSWSTVPTAKTDAGCDAKLSDVAAVGPDDVWAAGSVTCDGSGTSLVEHWDGKRWSRIDVPSPGKATYTSLSGITALSQDDVWAVGSSNRGRSPSRNLILHWDGKAWSLVASPNPGDSDCYHGLETVSGSGADDLWAAGGRSCSSGVWPEMLHWDGARWSSTPIPPSGFQDPPGDGLYGVVSLGKSNAVTVGIAKTRGPSVESGFIEHWNGQRWSLD